MKVATALMENGASVSFPYGDERYDLIADIPSHGLVRVQVKTGRWDSDSGSVMVEFRTKYKRKGEYHESYYEEDEIDTYGIYSPETNLVYWVEFQECGERGMRLRVEEGERHTSQTNWAEDYEIAKRLA